MKRVGLIGLGTITKHYEKGLKRSNSLRLTAVCDISPTALSRGFYDGYPFYLSYKEMIESEPLDCVIVSTVPALHFEISKWALEHGVSVIVEKPAVPTMAEYEELLQLADEKGLFFEVMYHWQTGSEIIKLNELFDCSKITSISTAVFDNYSQNGVEIDENKVNLQGVWLDSGVNVLSMIKLWLPFERVSIDGVTSEKCKKTGLPIFLDLKMTVDGVSVNILIDWRKGISYKRSYLDYDGRQIIVDHSAQTVSDGGEVIRADGMERLDAHYYNYFKNYKEGDRSAQSVLIHKLLFEVNQLL